MERSKVKQKSMIIARGDKLTIRRGQQRQRSPERSSSRMGNFKADTTG